MPPPIMMQIRRPAAVPYQTWGFVRSVFLLVLGLEMREKYLFHECFVDDWVARWSIESLL